MTTDQQGIYEIAGLPPDDYTLRLIDLPDTQCDLDREVKKEWFCHEKLLEWISPLRRVGSPVANSPVFGNYRIGVHGR